MKIINVEQMSPEWFAIKLGTPSASNFSDIITTKGEPSKSAKKYMYRLAGEFVSQTYEESYQNAAMLRGIELEVEARQLYAIINEVEVEQVGFCLEEKPYRAGASPDGMVGKDGIIEIKCPSAAVHVEYLLNGKMPSTYYQQVQGQLLVTGRKWCDFVSYYPGIKPFILRVLPDPEFQVKLQVQLEIFTSELKEIITKIK